MIVEHSFTFMLGEQRVRICSDPYFLGHLGESYLNSIAAKVEVDGKLTF